MALSTIQMCGLATLAMIIITALAGYSDMKGWTKLGLKWHQGLAALAILLAIIHALAGLGII